MHRELVVPKEQQFQNCMPCSYMNQNKYGESYGQNITNEPQPINEGNIINKKYHKRKKDYPLINLKVNWNIPGLMQVYIWGHPQGNMFGYEPPQW